jgi:hypothetical protein
LQSICLKNWQILPLLDITNLVTGRRRIPIVAQKHWQLPFIDGSSFRRDFGMTEPGIDVFEAVGPADISVHGMSRLEPFHVDGAESHATAL